MKYELQRGAHSVYSLYFHLICVTKYRTNVFDCLIAPRLKQLMCTISTTHGVIIVEQEIDRDQIHILFNFAPTLNLPNISIFIFSGYNQTGESRGHPQVRRKSRQTLMLDIIHPLASPYGGIKGSSCDEKIKFS
ncbi:MAG: transposase [Candidatus Hermodarchaeota archaeon]